MEHQNWNTTYLFKDSFLKGEKAAIQASVNGLKVEHIKKDTANSNSHLEGRYVAKVLNNEGYKAETVSHDFRIMLQQARQAKGWNQEKLANMCNEKKSVINEYESGRAIPQPAIINKLENALGCRLPRDKKKKLVN